MCFIPWVTSIIRFVFKFLVVTSFKVREMMPRFRKQVNKYISILGLHYFYHSKTAWGRKKQDLPQLFQILSSPVCHKPGHSLPLLSPSWSWWKTLIKSQNLPVAEVKPQGLPMTCPLCSTNRQECFVFGRQLCQSLWECYHPSLNQMSSWGQALHEQVLVPSSTLQILCKTVSLNFL